MKKIVVVGSSNTDMVVRTEQLPRPGETLVGGEFLMAGGGKGANQAVAAARMGHKVKFVAALGRDVFGDEALRAYNEYGIDTSCVVRKDAPSGVALIMVDNSGQNCISVALGANWELTLSDVMPVLDTVEEGDIVLLQLEVPIPTVEAVIDVAASKGAKVVLNPAPAAMVSEEVFSKLYLITPNQTEAETLTGIAVTDEASARAAAEALREKGVRKVVITLGGLGALLDDEGECEVVAAKRVKAIDATAAGDVYNGAICAALAEGSTLREAMEFATKASAISVTRVGAQPSIPTREEVDNFKN